MLLLPKYITSTFFIFMALLHETSASCCDYPSDDNSTNEKECRHVIVSKQKQPTSAGLHIVIIIPPHSCRINITEQAPTDNVIVLKSDSNRQVFGRGANLNNTTVSMAGTEFYFSRDKESSCPGQCLKSRGSTNESITVQVLYNSYNPGFTILYNEPKDNKSDKHHKDVGTSIFDKPQNQQPYPQNIERRRPYFSHGSPQYTWNNFGKNQRRGYVPPKPNLPVHNFSRTDYYRMPRIQYRHRNPPYNNQQYRHYLPMGRPVAPPNTETVRTPIQNRTKQQIFNSQQRGLHRPVISNPADYNRINYRPYSRIIPNRINNRHAYNPRINQHFPLIVPTIPRTPNYKNKPFPSSVTGDLSIKNHPRSVENSEKTNLKYRSVPEKTSHLRNDNSKSGELYEWKIAGFTECSRTCGGGLQQTRVVCVKIKSQVIVTAENCNNSTIPTKQQVSCNTELCEPSWQSGNWSSCSTSCGGGTRGRTIECTQTLSRSTTLKISADRCGRIVRPASIEQCHNDPCGKWVVKAWGNCKPECGQGSKKKRIVKCMSSNVGTSIPGRFCPRPRPDRVELCAAQHCPPKWYISNWSSKCSSNCGKGFTTRQVFCISNHDRMIPSSHCDPYSKPNNKAACSSSHPCGGVWFTGTWSECSADCGKGQRTREITCLKKFGIDSLHVVPEENCQGERPLSQENCEVTSCNTDWFRTEWSECSLTCGEGLQTREAKCFNKELKTSLNCSEAEPVTTRTCNIKKCRVISTKIGHSCVDKYGYKTCQLVMRARLCNNTLYKQKCCVTCARQQIASLH